MKYMGSKNRHCKEILPIILEGRKEGQYFVDLFAGGFNVVDKVSGNRIANDINEYLIEMFKALQKGWIPPETVSETLYKNVQMNKQDFPKHLVGYIGFNLSFGAKFFGGYGRDSMGKRNYSKEAFNNVMKQSKFLEGIEIFNLNYDEVVIPKDSIIYCDIPYRNTTKYSNKIQFDYEKFYQFCRDKKTEGHKIFISEYSMPEDFIEVWSKEVNNSLTKNTGSKKGVEKLFTL